MAGGKSPITSSEKYILDKTPTRPEVAVQAVDETLWALIELLVESGAADADKLSNKMEALLSGGLRKSGPLSTQEEKDRFALSLALERVRDHLPRKKQPR